MSPYCTALYAALWSTVDTTFISSFYAAVNSAIYGAIDTACNEAFIATNEPAYWYYNQTIL